MKTICIFSAFAILALCFFQCKNDDNTIEITCPTWYEGADCQFELRERYFGAYEGWQEIRIENNDGVLFSSQSITLTFSTASAGKNSMTFNGCETLLLSSEAGGFNFPSQTSCLSGLDLVTGSGSFSTDQQVQLEWEYFDDFGQYHRYTFSGTKI